MNPEIPAREESATNQKPGLEKPAEVVIHFVMTKAANASAIFADGAWFHTDPAGRLHMSFFNDDRPPAKNFSIRFDGSGDAKFDIPGPLEPVIREIKAEIVLSPDIALLIYNGLQDNLRMMGKVK